VVLAHSYFSESSEDFCCVIKSESTGAAYGFHLSRWMWERPVRPHRDGGTSQLFVVSSAGTDVCWCTSSCCRGIHHDVWTNGLAWPGGSSLAACEVITPLIRLDPPINVKSAGPGQPLKKQPSRTHGRVSNGSKKVRDLLLYSFILLFYLQNE